MVAVTRTGKLYHKPECTYIHGPAELESGIQAQAEGYTPCTRCLKE
jgi:methylphosphotriester-DNA--protein-cysteine methyltransferase